MSMSWQFARFAWTLPSTTRRSHEEISPESAISRPTMSLRCSLASRRPAGAGGATAAVGAGASARRGISIPGRFVSLRAASACRVGMIGIFGGLSPRPGREAGLPGIPRSSVVSMIALPSCVSIFLRPNILAPFTRVKL
jgi:hypothetical protein